MHPTAVAASKNLPAKPDLYADDSAYNQHASCASARSSRWHWQLQPVSTSHGIYVTHNGDFEFCDMFGQRKTCAEVKLWLASVLGSKAPAKCDSAGIAGACHYYTFLLTAAFLAVVIAQGVSCQA